MKRRTTKFAAAISFLGKFSAESSRLCAFAGGYVDGERAESIKKETEMLYTGIRGELPAIQATSVSLLSLGNCGKLGQLVEMQCKSRLLMSRVVAVNYAVGRHLVQQGNCTSQSGLRAGFVFALQNLLDRGAHGGAVLPIAQRQALRLPIAFYRRLMCGHRTPDFSPVNCRANVNKPGTFVNENFRVMPQSRVGWT